MSVEKPQRELVAAQSEAAEHSLADGGCDRLLPELITGVNI